MGFKSGLKGLICTRCSETRGKNSHAFPLICRRSQLEGRLAFLCFTKTSLFLLAEVNFGTFPKYFNVWRGVPGTASKLSIELKNIVHQ
jgi:hypothetical protein